MQGVQGATHGGGGINADPEEILDDDEELVANEDEATESADV
jgi:hypothetical protein